jgi:hypothetical protein
MALTRRKILLGGSACFAAGLVSSIRVYAESPAIAALGRSQLIYLSPVLTSGEASTCHGEVWYIYHGDKVYVVTQADAWRVEAIKKGLVRAKVWVGEFGQWRRAKGKYKSAPYLELEGELENNPSVHEELLPYFGAKYAAEWDRWGPRFRKGLANGSRSLLRYKIAD